MTHSDASSYVERHITTSLVDGRSTKTTITTTTIHAEEGRMNAYRLVSFFLSCSSTMASCSLTDMVIMFGHTQTVYDVNLLADPDVVHNRSCFALGSLGISNQVIPGAEHPPTEGEVLIGSAGQVQTGVLCHSAIGN